MMTKLKNLSQEREDRNRQTLKQEITTLAVIERYEEWAILKTQLSSCRNLTVLTFIKEIIPDLDQNQVRCLFIDDQYILDQWSSVNIWAREKAFTWYQNPSLKPYLVYCNINLAELDAHRMGYFLSWLCGRYAIFKKILSQYQPDEFIYFDESDQPASLNHLFHRFILAHNVKANVLSIKKRKKKQIIPISALARNFLTRLFSIFAPQFNHGLVFSGGLKHISPCLKYLANCRKQIKIPFCFHEYEFRLDQFLFCLKLKIPYVVSPVADSKDLPIECQGLINTLKKQKTFYFQGEPIPGLEEALISECKNRFGLKYAYYQCATSLCAQLHPKALVVEEDMSLRRPMVKAFSDQKIPIFVLSNGIPGLDFKINPEIRNAGLGRLIVHSEYEKQKYVDIGWEDGAVRVIGNPRYDRLHEPVQNKRLAKMKKHRKTILYCPHFINRIREKTFLGHMEWAGQYITELQTTALIHAAEAKPWDVWIKPHSDEGGAWKQFLSQFDQTQIRLLPFSSDISQLISCCDVLVTTFSTAAIEGRVAGKPVVSLNLTGLQDRHPYVEQKLVYAAKTESELRKTLEIILDQEKSDLCQPAFFLGRLKDGSAECVVEWILEETEMDVQINP